MVRIVVGVDGSAHSRRALRRAVEEARLRDATVDAVFAYPPPHRTFSEDLISLPSSTSAAVMGKLSPDEPAHDRLTRAEEAQIQAERQLEQFIEEATADMEGPAPGVVAVAAEHPAQALIDQSRTADLLVIGTRGLGGLKGMLLGSVAHQCIQRSRCPLLVLPPEEKP